MLRSAFVSAVVLFVAYAILSIGGNPQSVTQDANAQEKIVVRPDGSLQVCTPTSCYIVPASVATSPADVQHTPVESVVYAQPVASSSCSGSVAVSSLVSSQVVYRQPVRSVVRGSVRVVSAPVRFVRNRQPVRSVLRRVFCR